MKRTILVLMMCAWSVMCMQAASQEPKKRKIFSHKATAALFQAVADNNIKKAKEAIAADADLQGFDILCDSALFVAVENNFLDMVKLLIAEGVDVQAQGRGKMLPLHIAAREGALDVAEFLIANGANVNVKDHFKWTPLRFAVEKKSIEMIQLLIMNGAKIPDALSDKDIDFLDDVIRSINQKRAEEFAVLSALSALEAKGAAFNKKNMPAGLLKTLHQMFSSQRSLSPLPLASKVIAQRKVIADQ